MTRDHRTYWLLVLPALVLMLVFYIYPLLDVFRLSFTEPVIGLHNYQELVDRSLLHRIFWTTLKVCVITTIITVVFGYVLAYAMTIVGSKQRTWMMFCVLLTFWLSVLVRAFARVMLLRDEGIVNQTLLSIGIIDQPIHLVRNLFGVIVGMAHYMLPLAVLPLYSNLTGIDTRYVDAARGLGASPLKAFWWVYFPMSKPGVLAAAILVFIFSLGFFITPAILGGGKVVMVSEYIRVSFEETLRWGQATMLASTLLVSVVIALVLIGRFVDLRKVFSS